MLSWFNKPLCSALALVMVVVPALRAQRTIPAAPVPPQIASAHTVFVSNGGGSTYFNMFTGGSDRAYNTFYSDLQQSGRYTLASSPAGADLVFEIRAAAPIVPVASADGNDSAYNPELTLRILDPQTNAVLWTTSANVRAIGTQKRRDGQFDASVAVLMDKLAQVTGQPLTPMQEKAVRDNSRMSAAVKTAIAVSIVVSLGLMAFILYRGTHPPAAPALPAMP